MMLGIIGGSGLDNPALLKNYEEKNFDTPYGRPSSPVVCGQFNGLEVCIISRHGRDHEITPTNVNNRANIFALKKLGCTHIISTTAVGSLKEEIHPGDFVILDQFIDFTRQRKLTFYDTFENGPAHTSMADPFSHFLRKKIIQACEELRIPFHPTGTVITIEGPRFSTRAESYLFRRWGADVINMSIAPEAILANEAEIEYSAIAMSTDYDCWRQDTSPVSWEKIMETFSKNADIMQKLLVNLIEKLSNDDENFIKGKIRTVPNWPKQGVMFRDITTLLQDAEGFERVIKILEKKYKDRHIDIIAGIESRGFVIASALASRLKKGLVLIRKPGKLPHDTVSEEYDLEYGKDKIEIHKDAISPGQRVLLVDDLIATGGTALAAGKLIERLGGNLIEAAFIINLPELHGREKLLWPSFSVVEFEGE